MLNFRMFGFVPNYWLTSYSTAARLCCVVESRAKFNGVTTPIAGTINKEKRA